MSINRCFSIPLTVQGYADQGALVTVRKLSQMRDLFSDPKAVADLLEHDDPVIYEVYELPHPNDASDLLVNITVLYPGFVGGERYMTKGHFHRNPDTAEAVIGLEGEGELIVQQRDGVLQRLPVGPGRISYAGGGWGHRVINTGGQKLAFLSVSGANIEHDYETSAILNFKPQ
ncbi:glucose-6-phosphate isomerase family protein [Paenibacillus thermotolerans]|uniref:glucose-6-phosphate isomerase family protein n=1 Tax=Paenibacillus thermotolerans TaxID=3027807 RepID=UPI0023678FB1|nr:MULTISPECIES: glucose-6-phosphate isomerase family protein [unclassified Paenibacillus]